MAHQPLTFALTGARGPVTASVLGDVVLRTAGMVSVYLNVTSAASGSGGFWLAARNPNGVYFPLTANRVQVYASSGAQVTAVTNKRNINGDTLVTAAGAYTAEYDFVAAGIIAVVCTITAGTLTFDIYGDAK